MLSSIKTLLRFSLSNCSLFFFTQNEIWSSLHKIRIIVFLLRSVEWFEKGRFVVKVRECRRKTSSSTSSSLASSSCSSGAFAGSVRSSAPLDQSWRRATFRMADTKEFAGPGSGDQRWFLRRRRRTRGSPGRLRTSACRGSASTPSPSPTRWTIRTTVSCPSTKKFFRRALRLTTIKDFPGTLSTSTPTDRRKRRRWRRKTSSSQSNVTEFRQSLTVAHSKVW